jgi:hypothetical protein
MMKLAGIISGVHNKNIQPGYYKYLKIRKLEGL